MHWSVLFPYQADHDNGRWLIPFVPPSDHTFCVVKLPRQLACQRLTSRPVTSLYDWCRLWVQVSRAWSDRRTEGIITVFPQLAALAGAHQAVSGRRVPIVAWCFNVGQLYGALKGAAARWALRDISRFVVHSRRETRQYSVWLGLPEARFQFVPLQRPLIPIVRSEERRSPFIVAMGSAHRDYRTFFAVVRRLGIRATVVAAPYALAGLEIPPTVQVFYSLTRRECHELAQRARISVVPVANTDTASGQVTIVEAMCMGRPVVATRCMGSEDYVQDGVTGLLAEPGSVSSLADAIQRLWEEDALRVAMGSAARAYAAAHFSDENAGRTLLGILNELSESIS